MHCIVWHVSAKNMFKNAALESFSKVSDDHQKSKPVYLIEPILCFHSDRKASLSLCQIFSKYLRIFTCFKIRKNHKRFWKLLENILMTNENPNFYHTLRYKIHAKAALLMPKLLIDNTSMQKQLRGPIQIEKLVKNSLKMAEIRNCVPAKTGKGPTKCTESPLLLTNWTNLQLTEDRFRSNDTQNTRKV